MPIRTPNQNPKHKFKKNPVKKKLKPKRSLTRSPLSKLNIANPPLTHSKEKLLVAALDVFSKNGYHGTTTKMISNAAAVNEALITRHFSSKQGLFIEVVKRNLIHEPTQLPYPPKENLADELIAFADYIFNRDQKNIEFLRILLGHALQDPQFAKEMTSQLTPPASSLLFERLVLLKKKKCLIGRFDYEQVEGVVKNQIFASVLFSGLCHVVDLKAARAILHFGLKNFAKGLQAK